MSFSFAYPIVPTSFVENSVIFFSELLLQFVKNQLSIYVCGPITELFSFHCSASQALHQFDTILITVAL